MDKQMLRTTITQLRQIALFAVGVSLLTACGNNQSGMKLGDNEFAVLAVNSTTSDQTTSYPATIRGTQDIEVRPQVSGFIVKLCVDEGATVRKGQALFQIDPTQYAAAVGQAKAAVEMAKANVATLTLTEKNKKYVIAFDYKYLTDGKLAWSLEPQSAGNIFEESLLYRQTDESRETLNSQNRNTDWQVRKTAFAAENDNKYLAFFAKTAAGAAYDISIKNIRLYDLGDVDFSGKIDASDLAALKKELLGAESAAEFTDVNNDGYWDVRDLITLKKMLTNTKQTDTEEEFSNNPLHTIFLLTACR